MDLYPSQKDALTELINIGYARAAAALSDLTGHRIILEVPHVAIHPITELTPTLKTVLQGDVASVNQVFGGALSGLPPQPRISATSNTAVVSRASIRAHSF